MAYNQVFVFLAIIAVVLPTIAMATEYVVGDEKGWTADFDYGEWTKDKVFWVGDKLSMFLPLFCYKYRLITILKAYDNL